MADSKYRMGRYVSTLVDALTPSGSGILYRNPADVDEFFDNADLLRKRIIDNLVNDGSETIMNLWNLDSLLMYDPKCRVKMGRKPNLEDRMNGIQSLTSDMYQQCRGCNNMKLLSELESLHPISGDSNIEIWNVFSPEYGQHKGNQYQIVRYSNVKPSAKVSDMPNIIIGRILKQEIMAISCQPSLPLLENTEYHSLDAFSTGVLINWYLQYILGNMPFIRRLVYPFICGSDGYMLMEYKKYMKIDKHEVAHVYQSWNLIMQLFALLHRLKDYNFSFQSITMDTLIVEHSPCEYLYDHVNIGGEVTLKLNQLDDCGINVYYSSDTDSQSMNSTYQAIRIYRDRGMLDDFYSQIIQKVITWNRVYELASKPGEEPDSWVVYQIAPPRKAVHDYGLLPSSSMKSEHMGGYSNDNKNAFLQANRLGIPLYQGSFDAYRLMLLLCENKGFYYSLINDEHLNMLWKSMWTPGNYDTINYRIRRHHESTTLSYPYTNMLLGLDLRCNLISHVWEQLRVSDIPRRNMESKTNTGDIIQSPP
jgi:hypothetical protein